MKRVGEIRASGFVIKVYHVTDMEARLQTKKDGQGSGGFWGGLSWDGKDAPKIKLNTTSRNNRLREESMLHELLHLVNDLTKVGLKEKQIGMLSFCLFGILKDNFYINLNRLRYPYKIKREI